MVVLLDACDDLGRIVAREVRVRFSRERQDQAGVVAADLGQVIEETLAGDFDAGPLAPEIEASRGFDNVHDEGAADAGRRLEEIPPAIVVRTDELGVRNPPNEAEGSDDLAV